MKIKRDGHTHTEFCPHGSGDTAQSMIERAISLGFTHYSITEHAPMPEGLICQLPADQRDVLKTSNMPIGDTELYLKEMHRLKEYYRDRIQLSIGFELDYLEGYERWTRDFLNEYGNWIDDGVVSVHFMKLDGLFYPIDCSAEYVVHSLVPGFGGYAAFCEAYYRTVLGSIQADYGPHGPRRVGHMSLCRKYRKEWESEADHIPGSGSAAGEGGFAGIKQALKCLDTMSSRGYELDFNTGGLYQPLCEEFYPGLQLARAAALRGIPLVFGSDSHRADQVGRGYEIFEHVENRV